MSRVHDALRRAEQLGEPTPEAPGGFEPRPGSGVDSNGVDSVNGTAAATYASTHKNSVNLLPDVDLSTLLSRIQSIPFALAPETHLIGMDNPHDTPGEEFRTLRTRLNHLQTQQVLQSVVVTSASPAEGKTFTAVNLALVQAQLAENPVLLMDLDLRRPVVHNLFEAERSPGFSDYLLDGVPLEQAIKRIGDTNLYLLPAGSPVKNPLEMLNLKKVKAVIQTLPRLFSWLIIDTPPLLFSADANLLSTLTDGTLLVVRIGSTTYDNVIRAMQSLCENNVLGIVANGARASELYSKYTYYYSKHD